MPKFYSPKGNPEMWAIQPVDYLTEAEWLALNPPIPVTENEINTARILEIKKELIKLDMASIRPMRDDGEESEAILNEIIKQAQILRDELAGLE